MKLDKDLNSMIKKGKRILDAQSIIDQSPKINYSGLIWTVALLILLIIGSCRVAHASINITNPSLIMGYTTDQWATAIYHAEGGDKAQYPYGIRSVKCDTKKECRAICVRTIRNNFKRYNTYGSKRFATYINFLGSVYCPTKGNSLSASEQRVNGNWIKNVKYYLAKG